MKKKPEKKQMDWVWCRPGNHRVRRNMIAVHYEPGFGLCGHCILAKAPSIARYWLEEKQTVPS